MTDEEIIQDAIEMIDYIENGSNLSRDEVRVIIRAIKCALSVGEIQFETCVLSKQVKSQLTFALNLLGSDRNNKS